MRHALLLIVLLASLVTSVVPVAAGEDEAADPTYRVSKDGYRIKLEDGLSLAPGGELLITRRDLQEGFGVDVRRLIPRITPKNNRRRRQPRTWLLCYGDACARYKGPVDGGDGYETFPLSAVAQVFRWKVRREDLLIEIADGGGGKDRRGGKLGERIPDITLPDLEGRPHSLRALRGKRVLVVLWASWSTSREVLSAWAAEWKARRTKGLELWAVAVDIEGADRARAYVPPDIADRVVLDRDGRLAGLLGTRDMSRFALIDDLGLVRALGERPDTVDLAWIDAHLAETPRAPSDLELQSSRPSGIELLRAAVRAKPRRAAGHLALSLALEPDDPAAALVSMREAVRLQPKVSGNAVRLARMLLDAGERPEAMRVLDDARRANPGAMWLRRQYWALDEPNHFYTGPIDTQWQKQQKRKEDLEWGRVRRGK